MVQMMLGRGSIPSRPLRYRNQIVSANCSICNASNTYTIPADLDQDFEDTKMERNTTNDSLDFNPASHSHTPDYHRLLPALHAVATETAVASSGLLRGPPLHSVRGPVCRV